MTATPAFHPYSLRQSDPAPEVPAAGAPMVDVKGEYRNQRFACVPCSPEFDPNEPREYAGVHARHLAWAAPELLRHKFDRGLGAFHAALRNFTSKMRNALFMYSRVKRAMRWLDTPQEVNLFVDDLPPRNPVRRRDETPAPRAAFTKTTFKWEVAPKDVYQWDAFKTRYGFDIRGTSLDWIERRVRSARSTARRKAVREFRAREGLMAPTTDTQTPAPKSETAPVDTRTFAPASAQFGEIWPPVPVPEIATAAVTVTPDYASEQKAKAESNPDEAVIGVVFIEDDSTRRNFHNHGTWQTLTGKYTPNKDLKPP